jgi:Yip1 domain
MFTRIKNLVLSPRREWSLIATEPGTALALCVRYLLPFAVLAPIATVIGMMMFDQSWDAMKGYRVPRERIAGIGLTNYFFAVVTVLLVAAVFHLMTQVVEGRRDWMASLKVAVYGAIPLMLSGVVLFMPVNVIICLVALTYTLALYYTGVQIVMKIKKADAAMFVGVSMVVVFFASTILGAMAGYLGVM